MKEGLDEFKRQAKLVKRYGAAAVVMAFDEKGQADTYARKIDHRERGPTEHGGHRKGHATSPVALPAHPLALAGCDLHHQRHAGRRQGHTGQEVTPSQALRLAQQHHPQGNGADDEHRQSRPGVLNRQHQKPVVPGVPQDAQAQRRAHLSPSGPSLGRTAPCCAPVHPSQPGQRKQTAGHKSADREVQRRETVHDQRGDEGHAPKRTSPYAGRDAHGHAGYPS